MKNKVNKSILRKNKITASLFLLRAFEKNRVSDTWWVDSYIFKWGNNPQGKPTNIYTERYYQRAQVLLYEKPVQYRAIVLEILNNYKKLKYLLN